MSAERRGNLPIVPEITRDVVLERTTVAVVPKRPAVRITGPHRKARMLH